MIRSRHSSPRLEGLRRFLTRLWVRGGACCAILLAASMALAGDLPDPNITLDGAYLTNP